MAHNHNWNSCDWLFCYTLQDGEALTRMREYHYWISAIEPETGKPYLLYGCPAREGEEKARQRGMELLGGLDFQIKRYPTRDINMASSYLRGKRQEQTQSLKESSRRIGHNKSLRRLRRRRIS